MTKDRLIQCFNSGATTYDLAADIQILTAKKLASKLESISADQILEIGCGTGLFSQYLINHFPDKNILLMDISPEMIKTASHKFLKYPYVKFDCRDAENLQSDKSYDLIVSNMTLHWFSDFNQSLKKIIMQLKKGGHFIFTMLGEHSLHEWRKLYSDNILAFPKVESLKNQFPQINIMTEKYIQRYSNVYDFLSTLRDIGGTATHFRTVPLSPLNLRKIMLHTPSPFMVTYEIIYGYYTKP